MSTLRDIVSSECPNICQIFVLKDGREVYSDEWNDYDKDDCVHVTSATKTVMALLTGIAMDRRLIRSVNDKVLDYFPNYQVRRGEKTIQNVTLRHLLTMTAPYKCNGDPWTKVCSSKDWTKTSLDLLGGRSGLTGAFNYQTVCLHVLSGILYRASGMNTLDFANRHLFGPLGIAPRKSFPASSAEKHKQFILSRTPKRQVWLTDPQGLGTPGYGLCLSAKEMAKMGQMCLEGGTTCGTQILLPEWIREMTTVTSVADGRFRNMKYGYLTWILDEAKPIYAAIGDSGNVLYVDGAKNIVVAVASYFKPANLDRVDFIENVIIPKTC